MAAWVQSVDAADLLVLVITIEAQVQQLFLTAVELRWMARFELVADRSNRQIRLKNYMVLRKLLLN